METHLLTLLVILSCCTHVLRAYMASDVKSLMDNVINVNDATIRPVLDDTRITQVSLAVHLLAILNLDEVNQKLKGSMYMNITWFDEVLVWTPATYNYTYKIDPDPKYVWRPDISIANTYEGMEPVGGNFVLLHLYNTGVINWYPAQIFEVFCDIDVTDYPFDTQKCFLEFFVWGSSLSEVILTLEGGGLQLESYLPNGEWELTDTWVTYPNSTFGPISCTRVYLTLRRYPTFIFVSYLLPVFLLAFLNPLVFVIPVDSGEKVSYSITVLLSLAVFLSFISDQMPRTSTRVAAATIVLTLQMALSCFYIVLTILILRIHHKDEDEPMPACLARISLLECCCGNGNRVRKSENTGPKQPVGSFFDEKASWKKLSVVLDMTCFVTSLTLAFVSTVAYFAQVLS